MVSLKKKHLLIGMYICVFLQVHHIYAWYYKKKKTGVSWRWLWVLLTKFMSCARAESALNH